jgi:hypothetical protein
MLAIDDASHPSNWNWPPMTMAGRLVNELMLVSVVVAGDGAEAVAAELQMAGASAEYLGEAPPGDGFDLAVLLAMPGAAGDERIRAIVAALSGTSERLLFAPLPLGEAASSGAPPLPQLAEWFEVFAEFGYQPVIEFDAGFVSPGAFLVDRAAIAAEGDLSTLADRLQLGSDATARREAASDRSTEPVETSKAPGGRAAEVEAALAEARASLATARAENQSLLRQAADMAERHAEALETLRQSHLANSGWDALRDWVRLSIADPTRDTPTALARDLPHLNRMRGKAPPVALPGARRRRFWHRRVPEATLPILADTALVRASRLFDAAWYIASNPDLAASGSVDPAFHYVLVGYLADADPGPWFDTASYRATHPELAGTDTAPLVHAIRTGNDSDIPTE